MSNDKKILGYSEAEIKGILQQLKNKPVQHSGKPYVCGKDKVKYGLISDSHIGHRCYDSKLMTWAAKEFDKQNVDFVIHSGDIVDGFYTNRPGHVFELTHIGADAQLEEAVKELGQIKQPLYFITGNHEGNTYYKNAGHDIGKRLEERLDNAHYLGQGSGEIILKHNYKIKMIHPEDGSSYAISYKPQKIIESLEGGTKPAILHIGHYHKAEYIFYRNVHCVQSGTLESQTPFMKSKGLSAHKGFWIIEVTIGKNGITSFKPEFFSAYRPTE